MLKKVIVTKNCTINTYRQMSDFVSQYNENHLSTTPLQKLLLSVGSATMSLLDPRRADMIATLGETTGIHALKYIKDKMMNNPEGSEILQLQPRINSSTIDLGKLKEMPENTLGYAYSKFLDRNKVTPDSRGSVQFIDDIQLAYVMQRYREVHDLFHTVLGMPTNMLGKLYYSICQYIVVLFPGVNFVDSCREKHNTFYDSNPMDKRHTQNRLVFKFEFEFLNISEVTVKWIEAFQTKLPMTLGGGLFGAVRLKPKQREQYVKYYLPWAIQTGLNSNFMLNIYFEKRWEQPIEELHKELNIKPLEIIDLK